MPPKPIPYLSQFFKKHRRLYYDRLNGTPENENWTAWMDYFLEGFGIRQIKRREPPATSTSSSGRMTDKEKIEYFGRGAASAPLIYLLAK
jgi:Fic family protein